MTTEYTFAVLADKKTADELVAQGVIKNYSARGGWSVLETEYRFIIKEGVTESDAEEFISKNQRDGQRFRKIIWRRKE